MIEFDLDIPNGEVCEPENVYNVNKELNLAWDIIENTGANLFLTGRAGTGKTTFLKELRDKSLKRMIVLAPTGVAAINASGNTLHSFFQLPFAPYIPGKGFLTSDKKYLNVSRQKRRLISSLSLIVIDEISMVRPDTLDAIDAILKRLRANSRPFGGVQLLLIGDLRQLPPVVKDNEWEMLRSHYATPYFFESIALRQAGFQTVELSMVYRQSDRSFLDILNRIRDGKVSASTLDQLNERCIDAKNLSERDGYIRLTTHNRRAAAINDSRLNALPGEEFIFEAEVDGDFPESAFPVDRELRLKEGAQVMFVKNDTGSARRYYNGLIGHIENISEDKIQVVPQGEDRIIEVEKAEWENTRYMVDDLSNAITQQKVGTFRQYPLQLAWSITIHKSQGLTFDKAIIDATNSFAPGQTYVALSRCRSLEGLLLDSSIPLQAVITDSNVNDFIGYCERNVPDQEKVSSLKNDYAFTLIAELFDFEPIRRSFSDFARYVREYIVPLFPEIENEVKAQTKNLEDNLCTIGNRFVNSYRGAAVDIALADTGSGLSERIRKGCSYFFEHLEELQIFLANLPRNIDNDQYASRLNNAFEALIFLVALKMRLLKAFSKISFSSQTYLNAKADAVLMLDNMNILPGHQGKNRKQEKPPKEKKEKKPKGYSTFETLQLFREGKNIPQIVRERSLKENTIWIHIEQLIRLERIKPEEVVDTSVMKLVTDLMEKHPDFTFREIRELILGNYQRTDFPYFALRLCYNLNSNKV